ncbi:RNA-directed DNA polymerase [Pseudomonas aeruginosa]|nr:RNA-directed DNA polymerase [Pseudomonas aeruginosa]
MYEQPYTPTNLRRLINFSDKCKFEELHDSSTRKKIAEESSKRITKGVAFSSGLKEFRLGKKTGYGFGDTSDTLIVRLLAKNIRTAYPATQSNRQFLISNAVSIMKECLSYNVFRYDIQSFYESIDRKLLLEKITADGICTWQTILLIKRLFHILDIYDIPGLPRGLAISGALAEFRLLNFDQTIRHNNDVFFYGRFVDDILAVTSERLSREAFDDFVSEMLPEELVLHDGEKRSFIPVPAIHAAKKKNEPIQKLHELSYLGYKIRISNNSTKDVVLGASRREVRVDISDNKIQKLQDRLIKSFASYIASSRKATDFRLLKDRIRAITGNYEIRDPSTKIIIKTGIYYSYIHKNSDDDCALLKLDRFFRGLIFSRNFPLSIRIQKALSLHRRKTLIGYSFKSGFENQRFHSFSYKSFEIIKKVWL